MGTLEGNVWLLGGADLIHSFAKEGLIHRYIVTVLPNTYIQKGVYLKLPERTATSVVHGCAGGLSQFVFDMM